MQISPRYDGEPVVSLDGDADDVMAPFLRQRRRLLDTLTALPDDAWDAPSRCEGWRVREVVAHLADTDGFWALSLTRGLAGEPTRFLTGFDPKATPAVLVDAVRDSATAEVRDRYVAASSGLVDVVEGLDAAGWSTLAEAPPGHVPARLVVHHALWDSWVHERDILVPLGMVPDEQHDEVLASLRYGAALGPSFVVTTEPGRTGALQLDVTGPDARVVVEAGATVRVHGGAAPAGALVVQGPAVEVLEGISQRGPLPPVPDDHAAAWMLTGLAEVFETAPA